MAHVQDPAHETGVSVVEGTRDKDSATRPRERKANDALEMRLMGYGWDDIARVLGYPTPRAALVAFETALEKQLLDDHDSTAKMRDLAGRRLERLLRAVWGKAIDPDDPEQLPAVDRAVKVLAEHSRLFGLNAPSEMVVHSPTATEIQGFVAKVVSAANSQIEEGSIFDDDIEDAEVVGEPLELGV